MEKKYTNIKERCLYFAKNQGIGIEKFLESIDMTYGSFKGKAKSGSLNSDAIAKIYTIYPQINPTWLVLGEGKMLAGKKKITLEKEKNLIPVYEEVETFGGDVSVAEPEAGYSNTTMMIDAGDWFKGATAAIRHYGDSMNEYCSGCLLAIKRIYDIKEITPGRNYVIETSERRITKKIAELDQNHFMCYSTNLDTYPDGRQIHQPIKICKQDIRSISIVLGSVNKEESTGIVNLL